MKKILNVLVAMSLAALSGSYAIALQVDPASPFPITGQQNPQDAEKKTNDPVVIDVDKIRPPASGDVQLPTTLQNRGPGQRTVANEQFAGWKQAGLGENGESTVDVLRSNWVMIGSNGLLRGQVIGTVEGTSAGIPVSLLRGGKVLASSWTDENGVFTFNNVQQGTFSLVGFGNDAFFAFSFNAIDYADSIATKMPDQVTVLAVPNETTINLDWIRHFSPRVQFRVYGRFLSKQGTDDPAWLYGTEGISVLAPESQPATSITTHPVGLNATGFMMGRVHQIDELNGRPVDVKNTRVLLLQDDGVVAAATADNHGVFELGPVQPGRYALVAVGADGMGCVGIDAVEEASNPAAQPADFAMISPESVGWLNHTATEMAYQRIIGRKRESSENEKCQVCGGPMNNGLCCGDCGCQGMGGGSNSGLKRFWQDVNAFFDIMFYGETFQYGNQGGGNGGGYGGGYGDSYYNSVNPYCPPGAVPYQNLEIIEVQGEPGPAPAPTPAVLPRQQ